MAALVRALTYATLFIGLLLVFVPQQILATTGIARPERIGPAQIAGLAMIAVGGALALSCVLTFALIGKGTPAPFDPPRRLVMAGPYARVRNPMYIGAALALFGAALFFGSAALTLYATAFLVVIHLFVVFYEEPTLHRLFGASYDEYRRNVHRWMPTWRS
jgi:protein-S-isoprenylcysteine O-methyltransferase Ste14